VVSDQDALWEPRERRRRGRVRRALDEELAAARTDGTPVPATTVAILRTLADDVDLVVAELSTRTGPDFKAYDRVPLVQLVAELGRQLEGALRRDQASTLADLLADLDRTDAHGGRPVGAE